MVFAQVDFSEDAIPVAAYVLLPHEMLHALSMQKDKDGKAM